MRKCLIILFISIISCGCAHKITKIELMSDFKKEISCDHWSCKKGIVINQKVTDLEIACLEEVLQPYPNEVSSSQMKEIQSKLNSCVDSKSEFTPVYSKEKMILALMDMDNSHRFPEFKHSLTKLGYNNLLVNCYKIALKKMPDILTLN